MSAYHIVYTVNSWERKLDVTPKDWDLRSAYADWLEEQGMGTEAEVQRWLAYNQRSPDLSIGYGWKWYDRILLQADDDRSQIPLSLLQMLPGHADHELMYYRYHHRQHCHYFYRSYDTREVAERAIVTVWEKWKQTGLEAWGIVCIL